MDNKKMYCVLYGIMMGVFAGIAGENVGIGVLGFLIGYWGYYNQK